MILIMIILQLAAIAVFFYCFAEFVNWLGRKWENRHHG